MKYNENASINITVFTIHAPIATQQVAYHKTLANINISHYNLC